MISIVAVKKCVNCGHQGIDVHTIPWYNPITLEETTRNVCDNIIECLERKEIKDGSPV